jgi:hypothetical protein
MKQTNYKHQLIDELAANGNKQAMMDVCQRYFDTKDCCNNEQVMKYLSILSEDNNKRAMLLLGIMFYSGLGVQQNYKEAAKWYEKAADGLEPYGLCNLGYCYSYGRDMDVDHAKAYDCFSKSAYLGNANAMYKLGDMFFYGNHVDEDKKAAFYWYNEALNRGRNDNEVEPNVKYRLGRCYLHGYGTEKNILLAMKFLQDSEIVFFKQISNGDTLAERTLVKVKKELENARDMMYHAIGLDFVI